MEKKEFAQRLSYQSPIVKVVSFRMEQGIAASGGMLGVTHEGFEDEAGGHEGYTDNTSDPDEETNWFVI